MCERQVWQTKSEETSLNKLGTRWCERATAVQEKKCVRGGGALRAGQGEGNLCPLKKRNLLHVCAHDILIVNGERERERSETASHILGQHRREGFRVCVHRIEYPALQRERVCGRYTESVVH